MGFLNRLFGGAADQAKPVPSSRGAIPQISLERQALESLGARLAFGDPVAQASVFGQPDDRTDKGILTQLVYAGWGLTLEFEQDRFIQASFDLKGPNADRPDDPFASTRVKGPDDGALTQKTSKADLLRRFGTPTKTQDLGDETILYYHHGPLVSEFQLDDEGLLSGWDVYLD
jgi:hypothetical protein